MIARLRRGGAWRILWGVPALVALVHFATTGRPDTLQLALQFLFAMVLASSVAVLPTLFVRRVLLALIGVLLLAGAAPALLAITWDDGGEPGLVTILERWLPSRETVGERTFGLPADGAGGEVTVAFDAVAPTSDLDTGWLRSHASYVTTHVLASDAAFTRVVTPSTEGAYLRKIFDLGAPTGGTTVRATWEMRVESPIEPAPCRGVVLHTGLTEVGRAGVRCESAQHAANWQGYEVVWRPPAEVDDTLLNFDLRDLEGVAFDIRNVTLEVLRDGAWADAGPAIPDAPYVSVAYAVAGPRLQQMALRPLKPSATPTPHRIDATAPASAERLVVKVHGGAGHADASRTQVTNLVVRGADGRRLPALLPEDVWARRQSLLYDHPNLAGHAAAVAGIGAVSTLTSTAAAVAVAGGTIAAVGATGSRAALAGFVLGLALLLAAGGGATRTLSVSARGRRALAWAGSAIVLGTLLVSGAGGRLRSVDTETVDVRVAIWRASAEAFRMSPWTGMAPSERSELYATAPAIPIGSVVSHAHNLGLDLASLYGVFGVVMAVWVSIGLATLAWRWGGGIGIAILIPIVIGQFVDVTLFSIGVLLPAVLALDLLRRQRQSRNPSPGDGGLETLGAGGTT